MRNRLIAVGICVLLLLGLVVSLLTGTFGRETDLSSTQREETALHGPLGTVDPYVEDPSGEVPDAAELGSATADVSAVGLTKAAASFESTTEEELRLSAEEEERLRDLIADLADDDRRFNALKAAHAMRGRREPVPLLQEALDSDDYQQRQIAADLLRSADVTPNDRLLEVTVEGLQNDELGVHHSVANARSGVWYLGKHARAARKHLVRALDSDDVQQSFFAAYLLGRAGDTTAIAKSSAILIDHLADNSYQRDACMSCQALYKMGQAVVPYLEPWLDSADRQQRETVQLVWLNLTDPTSDPVEKERRHRLNKITRLEWDPSLSEKHRETPGMADRELWRAVSRAGYYPRVPRLIDLRAQYSDLVRRDDYHQGDHAQFAFGVWQGHDFVRLLTLQVHRDGSIYQLKADGSWMRVAIR